MDPKYSEDVDFSATVEFAPGGHLFENRHQFGVYLAERLATVDRTEISFDRGLWNWLAAFYFDQLSPKNGNGARLVREPAVYCLPSIYQHNRYYRHLVRTPWLAASLHPETSRVILIPVSGGGNPLSTTGEIFEQVASRQGIFRSEAIMKAIDRLYFDESRGRPRSGSAGGSGGSPRRLGQLLKQFELTFDLEGNQADVVSLLPKEFNKWKMKAMETAQNQGLAVAS